MNKKQKSKLKKKLRELGVNDFLIYPCYNGYRLRFDKCLVNFDMDKSGLTKSKMEAILEQVRLYKSRNTKE